MNIQTTSTASRYLRTGVESFLLAAPTAGGAQHLAVTLVELQPGGAQAPHAHEPEQAYFILDGTGLMEVGGERTRVQAGDCVFIPSGAIHGLVNDGGRLLRYLSAGSPAFTAEQCRALWPLASRRALQEAGPARPAQAFRHRVAVPADSAQLAEWNAQLIADEGHRNRMTAGELEARMRTWLEGGEYTAVVFADGGEDAAYALYRETDADIHLRQLFVARHRRREGIGRRAVQTLQTDVWNPGKRRTVEVLAGNAAAIQFWRAMGYADYSILLEMRPATG